MSFAAVASAAITVGGSLLGGRSQRSANEANQTVDLNNMTPEGRKALEGLFGTFSDLAKSSVTKLSSSSEDRSKLTSDALAAGLQVALNKDLPGLQATLASAGAYNSSAYGIAANDAITNSLSKFFFEAQQTAQKDQALELEKLGPILQLLGIDKGSVQKGKAAGSGATDASAGLGTAITNGLDGVVRRLFSGTDGVSGINPYNP